MVGDFNSDFDEDAAIEAMWESLAAPHPRDVPRAEQDRELKGYARDVALEKWGPMIEEMMMADIAEPKKRQEAHGQVLAMVRPQKNPDK